MYVATVQRSLGVGYLVQSRGPPTSFERFIAEHRGVLEARARQLCRGHLDPADLVQECLLRAFRHYGSLRDPKRGRAWLLQILTRSFFDLLRKQRSEPAQQPLDDVDLPELPPEAAPAWDSITLAQLQAAVERLPEDVRGCYRMHALEGKNYVFIAAKLGIPSATVGTRLLRARRKLREILLPGSSPEVEP